MRVVFITREGYHSAGARVRCYNFARELKKYGVSSEVISFADDFGAACGEDELKMPLQRRLFYSARAFRSLLEKEKDSIFFVQRFHYHALAPLLVSLIKRQKIVFDCDDWNIRENPQYHFGFYPSSKMEFLTRHFARYAGACIAASHFLLDFLKSFNKKVFYVPTGVDTDFFSSRETAGPDGSVVLGWAGTVYHEDMYRNLKFIVDVFGRLAVRHRHITLALAGEGRYFDKMKEEVKNHSYKGRIRIAGWVPPDEMPSFLSGVHVGLLPLLENTKFNQAKSPTKLFEYMAMGKAVVASRVGDAEKIIEDGNDGILASSEAQFIAGIERLVEDCALRRRMGERARWKAEEKYSLHILGKRLAKILCG